MLSARIIGIPGAGKTYRAMEIVGKCREMGYGLFNIGFSSFTRAARREASRRAVEIFGGDIDELEQKGWFRTIHSTTMRLLGVQRGELVTGDKDWFKDALGEELNAESLEDADTWSDQFKGMTPVAMALQFWDVARNSLRPLQDVCEDAGRLSMRRIDLGQIEHIVQVYEAAKLRDGRSDFTDFLLRYAGYHANISHGITSTEPQGSDSKLPVWFQDEAQDASPLLDEVYKRLTKDCRYFYLMGDPDQEIYSWAGADGNRFMQWPHVAEDFLGKSWRCSRAILELGRKLISRNESASHYATRKLEPAREGGTITEQDLDTWLARVRPDMRTLVMARTNRMAAIHQAHLTNAGIPWRANKGAARFPREAVSKLANAMAALERGEGIDREGWARIVQAMPTELLQRGAKKKYMRLKESKDFDAVGKREEITSTHIYTDPAYGGTEKLVALICSGHWRELISAEDRKALTCKEKHGALADHPRVIVSTVHGTKGMEAEDVFLDTSTTIACERGMQSPEGMEQERRVWYVGATRARENLHLIRGSGSNFQEIYECI